MGELVLGAAIVGKSKSSTNLELDTGELVLGAAIVGKSKSYADLELAHSQVWVQR